MGIHPQRQYSAGDYHRIEETSPIRHELFNGEIFAMAGGSVAHNHISANVLAALRSGLANTPYSTFGSDMRLLTPGGLLTYPDVMVICGQINLVAGRQDEVTNPVLLVEVLSDATRNYDRGEKFDFYKAIPTFREYSSSSRSRSPSKSMPVTIKTSGHMRITAHLATSSPSTPFLFNSRWPRSIGRCFEHLTDAPHLPVYPRRAVAALGFGHFWGLSVGASGPLLKGPERRGSACPTFSCQGGRCGSG